jgi:prepilin-type N-terminal cleavage/methylation domain-containing protein
MKFLKIFKDKTKQELGLTLIEVLIVVVIIGVLSGFILLRNQSAVDQAVSTKAKAFATGVPVTLAGNYIANWKFNQVSGTAAPYIALDSYGANTGTLGDGTCAAGAGTCPTQLSGSSCVYDGCFSFDGGDYIRVGSAASPTNFNFASTGSFSAGAWIKTSTNASMIISDSWILSGANNGWIFYIDSSTGYLKFYGSATTSGAALGTKLVSDNIWHYVFLSYANKVVTFYVDGIADTPVTVSAIGSGTMSTSTYGAVIGACFNTSNSTFSNYFNGSMDDVAVYDGALSTSQIKQNYLVGLKNLLARGQISQSEYFERLNNSNNSLANK